jgi:hypothetical protein
MVGKSRQGGGNHAGNLETDAAAWRGREGEEKVSFFFYFSFFFFLRLSFEIENKLNSKQTCS